MMSAILRLGIRFAEAGRFAIDGKVTADLAGEFGVSIRTLDGAVSQVRGMSLHQYIRLKRLWATRARLLKGGGATVATCARAQGFHHLGEFAAAYRATFHEAPSDTLARGRQTRLSAD